MRHLAILLVGLFGFAACGAEEPCADEECTVDTTGDNVPPVGPPSKPPEQLPCEGACSAMLGSCDGTAWVDEGDYQSCIDDCRANLTDDEAIEISATSCSD